MTLGDIIRSSEHTTARDMECPYCGADLGEPCVTPRGAARPPHVQRWHAVILYVGELVKLYRWELDERVRKIVSEIPRPETRPKGYDARRHEALYP